MLDSTSAAAQINVSSAGVNVGGTVGGLYFGAVSSTTPTAAFDYWFDDCAYGTVPLDIPAAQWVDLYLSTDGGATAQLYATQQSPSGTWIFRTPASGIDYSVQAVAHANQTAAAASPWVR